MGTPVLIIGESGNGKSTSLRNLNPNDCILIQTVRKPLPFKNSWKPFNKTDNSGSIVISDKSEVICRAINFFPTIGKKIIIIDDWNLVMTNEYMRRSEDKGFKKFSDIAKHAWDLLNASTNAPDDVRIYFLGHSEQSEHGQIKAKTIGKMIDQTFPVESFFSIVLRACNLNGKYFFTTKNNGFDTCKSPIGLFEHEHIDNDLKFVDDSINSYYEI